MAEMAATEVMRIEDLAQATGVSTRNIRAYQSLGLLAPPTRRGRVGHYGAAHVERLRAITRLHADGFSLAAIRALYDARAAGRTLDDLLGDGSAASPGRGSRRPDAFDELAASLVRWRGARTGLLPATFVAEHLATS